MSSKKIWNAIIGGGLAGASVANALFQHPHLDVHVYESASEFWERGTAMGLSSNFQLALNHVNPPPPPKPPRSARKQAQWPRLLREA